MSREGRIVYEQAVGLASIDEGRPFTLDTPTNIASLAKTMTAALVLMHHAEGKLDLDDPVTRYLPAFPYGEITVRQLLSHSSGLPSAPPGEPPQGVAITNQLELDTLVARSPRLSFEPDSGFLYSNIGYNVAALVLEQASGTSFPSLLQDRIFDPLGMTSAFVRPAWNRDWPGARTRTYQASNGQPEELERTDGMGFYGSGGIYLSARDLNRWAVSQYSNPVLDEVTFETGLGAPIIGGSHRSVLSYLGWYRSDDGRRFYFTGVDYGFRSTLYWDRDRRQSIVFVGNTTSPSWDALLLRMALVDILEGRPPGAVTMTNAIDLNITYLPPEGPLPVEITAILGEYSMNPGPDLTIGLNDECRGPRSCWPLFLRYEGGLEYPLFPGPTDLYAPGRDIMIWFEAESDMRTLHTATVFGGLAAGTRVPGVN